AILLREASDSNTIADNDLTASTIGVLVTGLPPLTRPSVGNLIYRNDASLAAVVGFAARGTWGVSFVENRADSAGGGFELLLVTGGNLRGNTVIGCRRSGIEATSGGGMGVEANGLLGGPARRRGTRQGAAAR